MKKLECKIDTLYVCTMLRMLTYSATSPGKCRFPVWLTGHTGNGMTWHTLDLARSYTFHPRNATLHVTRSNVSLSRFESGVIDGMEVPGQDEQGAKIVCNSVKQSNPAQSVIMIVAHFTIGWWVILQKLIIL